LKKRFKEFEALWHNILKPGAHTAVHEHPYEEFYYILSGKGIMTVGDEEQLVDALDVIYIPGWAKHGIVNNTEEDITYLCVAAPRVKNNEEIDKSKGFDPDPEFQKMIERGEIDISIK
jgi:mannose-6-phosphate isomerase-like protein (cupin superfamily)